jgi:hypothetical protein
VSMHEEEKMDPTFERLRETYNVPPETPRERMWSVIAERIAVESRSEVLDLASARERRASRDVSVPAHRLGGWAVAAAAVLVLGIGIGRMTAPADLTTVGVEAVAGGEPSRIGSMTAAAAEHLNETESMLTMVRADARDGRVDPATAAWANGLLSQTRLLLDAQTDRTPAVDDLLLDLELVLVQIVGVTETGSIDEARARTELALALRSLDEGEVLPRIQAVLPNGLAGT